jgi:hypothetical protein
MNKTEHAPATSSRRGLLMGLAAATAVSAPVSATALAPASGVDPIFALIDRHLEVTRAWDATGDVLERLQKDWFSRRKHSLEQPPDSAIADAEDQQNIWSDHEKCAADAIVETTPTTLAGVLAAIRYVLSHYDGESEVYAGLSHDLLDDEQMLTFIATIGDAIEASLSHAPLRR